MSKWPIQVHCDGPKLSHNLIKILQINSIRKTQITYNYKHMTLRNITKKTLLSTNLKEAKSTADKFLGLLRKSNPRSLMFKTRFGIHTFLLKSPIDVLILDSEHRVVSVKNLKPNRIFIYNPMRLLVIELPTGTIQKSKTQEGDTLTFK